MFPGSQWCWKQLLDHYHVFISLALVINRLNIVALLFCARAHSLKLLTFKPPQRPGKRFLLFVVFCLSFFPFLSRLPARSRLRGPPADNYRYLFFINEVKSQLSLPFLELRGKLFLWWLGSFNRCLFHFKCMNICIHICRLGRINTRVIPTDTHLAQLYSKQRGSTDSS